MDAVSLAERAAAAYVGSAMTLADIRKRAAELRFQANDTMEGYQQMLDDVDLLDALADVYELNLQPMAGGIGDLLLETIEWKGKMQLALARVEALPA